MGNKLIVTFCAVMSISSFFVEDVKAEEKLTAEMKELLNKEEVFDKSLDTLLPVSPDQLQKYKNRTLELSDIMNDRPAAKIRQTQKALTLDVTKPPQPVYLTPLYVGSLAFFDSQNNPWRVEKVIVGNTNLYNLVMTNDKEEEKQKTDGHIVYVTPLQDYANSNLLVYLEGTQIPLNIPLISSSSHTDERVHDGLTTYLVKGMSPTAPAPIISAPTVVISDIMIEVLNNTPPSRLKKMKTTLKDGRVSIYEDENCYYVRAKDLRLLLPSFKAQVTGVGVSVYETPKNKKFVFIENGQTIDVEVLR